MTDTPATILIVDDLPDNRHLLVSLLKAKDYRLIEAADGQEAIALSSQADLILLDVMRSGMDGLEVCRRLRQQPATCFVPIVMVTALSEKAGRIAAIRRAPMTSSASRSTNWNC